MRKIKPKERRRTNGIYKRENIRKFKRLSVANEVGSSANENAVK